MHAIHQAVAESTPTVDFRTGPEPYRHRELSSDGPETMETRIFRRLSTWQYWIFSTANAVGESGSLKLNGTDRRAVCDSNRD